MGHSHLALLFKKNIYSAIALDEMHSSDVLCSQFACYFFGEVAVGVGESNERYQSGPARTAPLWLRLSVCMLAIGTTRGRTGRGYGVFVVVHKGQSTC